MPLCASLASLVADVRARGLDRDACDRLVDRCVAAAARRELAGRLPCDALLWRHGVLSSRSTMVAAGERWCLSIVNSTIMVHMAQASSLDVLVLVGEVGMQAGLHSNGTLLLKNMWRAWSSELASLFCMWRTASSRSSLGMRIVGAGRRAAAAAAGRVARARLLIAACLHLNPSMALTTALANSFRLREAAAVVASGGDAGDDGGDPPPVEPSSLPVTSPPVRRVATVVAGIAAARHHRSCLTHLNE